MDDRLQTQDSGVALRNAINEGVDNRLGTQEVRRALLGIIDQNMDAIVPLLLCAQPFQDGLLEVVNRGVDNRVGEPRFQDNMRQGVQDLFQNPFFRQKLVEELFLGEQPYFRNRLGQKLYDIFFEYLRNR